jgi:hypothetical protein
MTEWTTEGLRNRYVQGQYALGVPNAGWRFDQVLAAHDAEVAAKALEDAAAHVHGFAEDRFDDARGEGFSASSTSPDYQRGRAYEQACLWLRARAAAIRAETQREGVGCKHCGRPIAGEGGHIHTAGANRGLHRCDPNDSGLPYGLCAEAVGDACGPICTGGQ